MFMKLYDLPRDDEVGTKIYTDVYNEEAYVRFHHLDGMYSYCTVDGGGVAHIAASAPIEVYKDGYRIQTP